MQGRLKDRVCGVARLSAHLGDLLRGAAAMGSTEAPERRRRARRCEIAASCDESVCYNMLNADEL